MRELMPPPYAPPPPSFAPPPQLPPPPHYAPPAAFAPAAAFAPQPPCFASPSHLVQGMAGAVVIDERPMTPEEAAWMDRLAGAGTAMGLAGPGALARGYKY
jgi:hypothetical protein